MESMADRQGHGVVAGFQKCFDCLLDRLACSSDHRLAVTVDVGGYHVTIDRLQNPLDFLDRSEHGRHPAVVFKRHARHFAAARADGFHSVLKRKGARNRQSSVFSHAMAHRHVGMNAVGGHQPGHRNVGRDDGRLSNRSLAKIFFGLGDSLFVGCRQQR